MTTVSYRPVIDAQRNQTINVMTYYKGCAGNMYSAIALPFWLSGFGILCSVIGMFCVSTDAELPSEEKLKGMTAEEKLENDNHVLETLLWSVNKAIYLAGFLVLGLSAMCCFVLFQDTTIAGKLYGCILIGLVSGMLIGAFTEYSTAYTQTPTQSITEAGKTGPATVVIQGLGVGMIGTSVPTVVIIVAICSCNALGGLYGIAIAAVGMLSTLAITLATDAYGPVADNAGGIAEMIETMSEAVRDNTDALDAMGNTTAATGKGFAIGSAFLPLPCFPLVNPPKLLFSSLETKCNGFQTLKPTPTTKKPKKTVSLVNPSTSSTHPPMFTVHTTVSTKRGMLLYLITLNVLKSLLLPLLKKWLFQGLWPSLSQSAWDFYFLPKVLLVF